MEANVALPNSKAARTATARGTLARLPTHRRCQRDQRDDLKERDDEDDRELGRDQAVAPER